MAPLVGVSILQKNLTSPAFSVLSTVETETVAISCPSVNSTISFISL